MTRQVCFYANGLDGSSIPFVSIQKQSTEKVIRLLTKVDFFHQIDSKRVRLISNFASYFRIARCSLGCHRVIRRNDELGIVELSTLGQLEDEALGFVRDGWTMFEIEIKLFDEREFDEAHVKTSGLRASTMEGARPSRTDARRRSVIQRCLSASMVTECRGKKKEQWNFLHFHSEQVQVLRHVRGLLSQAITSAVT